MTTQEKADELFDALDKITYHVARALLLADGQCRKYLVDSLTPLTNATMAYWKQHGGERLLGFPVHRTETDGNGLDSLRLGHFESYSGHPCECCGEWIPEPWPQAKSGLCVKCEQNRREA